MAWLGLSPNDRIHGTPDQWRDYWWNRRAYALIEIGKLQTIVDECDTGLAALSSTAQKESQP